MSKIDWSRSRESSSAQRIAQAGRSIAPGIAPATAKQIRFLETLARKLGQDPEQTVSRTRGNSQTLSAKNASRAIDEALQRLGGPATLQP